MRHITRLGLAAILLTPLAYAQTTSQTTTSAPAQNPTTSPTTSQTTPGSQQTTLPQAAPVPQPTPSTTPDPGTASTPTISSDPNASDPKSASGRRTLPKPGDDGSSSDVASITGTPLAPKTDSLPSPGEALNPHIKAGSEDDVNAIGTRNIGGRGMGNWYSTDWEIRVGKQYSMEIEKSAHLVTDPVIVEYVNRVGQNLVKNSDAKVPFTIKVIDSDEINAMALPGGFFYVNSGLIMNCDEEAELAGVMAHEISHVIAHHAARQQTKMNYAQIASIPLIIMTQGSYTGYGIYEASQLAIPLSFLKFSRMDESEADYLGVQYMYKAGYDPQSFVTLFEKLDALEKHKPGTLAKAFSDHPATGSRITAAEDEIATILPARPEYIVTTSEFDDVKARLARIENKRKINDKSNGNKPTLRRADAGNTGTSPNPNSTGSDQPTLGRRN